MKTIELKDVGPVQHLTIPIPEEGGIVCLKGRNGAGKTRSIDAVTSLLEGKGGSLSARDRSLGGAVEGLGCRITVGRRAKCTGELEVSRLEGEDPSILVDPGLKDADAADARRIAALCRLARVQADPGMFAELLPGGLDELRLRARPASLELTSVPEMAAALKRDLEAHARSAEGAQENAEGQGQGLLQSCQGIDIALPHDEAELARDYEAAAADLAQLEGRRRQAEASRRAAEEARLTLERAGSAYQGPSVADAQASVDVASAQVTRLQEEMAGLQRRLVEAKGEASLRQRELAAAQDHERQVRAAQEALGQVDAVEAPAEEDLAAARRWVEEAREAQQQGVLVRRALEQRRQAQAAFAEASRFGKDAEQLRAAARNCEQVVTAAIQRVAPRGLRVHDGRLVLDTERGETLFSELSHGERWRVSLDVAIDAVGEGGVLPIAQEAFEGLDPANRAAIAEHAKRRKTVLLTAEADGGDLRAEVYAG